MKKCMLLFLSLMMLLPVLSFGEGWLVEEPQVDGNIIMSFSSPTLVYTIEQLKIEGNQCFFTTVWMQDPGRQIKKATSVWHENLVMPDEMAGTVIPLPRLVINGSGYVSKTFPDIPDNYPGDSPDYYYQPLGSITVTNGEIWRKLEGVPYYGLTLQADGLHMHTGEEPEQVLAQEIMQTWSFYECCPLILNGHSILDTNWPFANRRAIRTIIMKLNDTDNSYGILTVSQYGRGGMTLVDCVDYLLREVQPVWAYDLDGGPSSALLARGSHEGSFKVIYGNERKDVDIMAFCELEN